MCACKSTYSMSRLRIVRAERALAVKRLQQRRVGVAEGHLHASHAIPAAVREDRERRAHRAHAEVVLAVELASALEAVEERGEIEDLHTVVHEPALDEVALRQRARGGVLGHVVS